ncbi:MAG: ParB/RepB/Spo0J family partition protein, partial [Spirochaetota bacterium]
MAKRVTGLGRGLDALLPPDEINDRLQQMKRSGSESAGKEEPVSASTVGSQIQELPLSSIQPAGSQPRKYFDNSTISELAQSIFEHGLIQPILVTADSGAAEGSAKYRIIAGERRFRACQVLKWQRIPVIVKTIPEVECFELALIENIQREDLTPIDEALAYEHLLRISGLSQNEMAKRLGKGRSALTNSLRLLQLPPVVQEGLSQGLIRSGHAKALLMLKESATLIEVFQRCVAESWSVRQVERYCQELDNHSQRGAEGEPDLSEGIADREQERVESQLENWDFVDREHDAPDSP